MRAIGDGTPGFTLFEMLVVLAILGLIAGLAYPLLGRAARAQALAAAVATATAALGDARARALREDRAVAVVPDPGGLAVAGGGVRPLPAGMAVEVRPAAGILFLPDGTSRGGEVTLALGGAARRLRVAPATGLVDPGG